MDNERSSRPKTCGRSIPCTSHVIPWLGRGITRNSLQIHPIGRCQHTKASYRLRSDCFGQRIVMLKCRLQARHNHWLYLWKIQGENEGWPTFWRSSWTWVISPSSQRMIKQIKCFWVTTKYQQIPHAWPVSTLTNMTQRWLTEVERILAIMNYQLL